MSTTAMMELPIICSTKKVVKISQFSVIRLPRNHVVIIITKKTNMAAIVNPYSWFSCDVIAAMLVSHEQKISH
jgi:hypothetical protein